MTKDSAKRSQSTIDISATGDRQSDQSAPTELHSLGVDPRLGAQTPMKKLWVLGDAVQDVTVEIDLELLLHEDASLRDSILLDDALSVKDGDLANDPVGAT
jgi:hypothetical protein